MQKCNSQLRLLIVTAAIIGVASASAQKQTGLGWIPNCLQWSAQSWVLKGLTLDEKLALVCGNGMFRRVAVADASNLSPMAALVTPKVSSAWVFLSGSSRMPLDANAEQVSCANGSYESS
jgi:hypothetical protein